MQSAAFVVGPREGPGDAMLQLCAEMNFSVVEFYEGPDQPVRHRRIAPVSFFFVSSAVAKSKISTFVTQIRHHADRVVRFSPILFLCEDPSPRTIQFCVHAGFDDIIAPPFSVDKLTERVRAQLRGTQLYFESSTYFGPDRRGADGGSRRGRAAHKRFEIVRDLVAGIRVSEHRVVPVESESEARVFV